MKNELLVRICFVLSLSLAGAVRAERVEVPDAPFPMPSFEVPSFPARDFPIDAYGAKPDGTKCTAAIAAAMAACEKAGGGRVVVPRGTWLTGAVHFRSNCNLHLAEGATLAFTDDPADYLPAVRTSWEGVECLNYSPLLYACGVENVAITGTGTLAPRMNLWRKWFMRPPAHMHATECLYHWCSTNAPLAARDVTAIRGANVRPHLIQFNRAKGILLDGFRIRQSPFWMIHLFHSENAVVRNLDTYAHGHNNDGVDIEMTKNVLVENCRFDQGDDGIVLKAGRNRDAWRLDRPTENVVVRNCEFVFAHTLVGIGSELSGGIRNFWLHDCKIKNSYNLLYVKTNRRRGGFVENIHVENIDTENIRWALFGLKTDVLYQWAKFPDYELRYTKVRGIHVKNVHARCADWAFDVTADAHEPARDLHFENVRVDAVRKGFKRIENAENVTLENATLGTGAATPWKDQIDEVWHRPAAAGTSARTTVTPKATGAALVNPDMGFCFYKYAGRLWAYGVNVPENDTLDWFPGCSTVYMRVLWNDIEPEEGRFRWDLFDSAAQNWIAKGKKIAIRIVCCNQTENATPEFVRAAGAKGFWFEYKSDTSASGKLPPRWEPKYDDPVFLGKFSNFLRAFARRYDGNPGVAFMDVGSFGMYGEGHLSKSEQAYLARPENRAEFERLAKLHLDLWKKFLPNTYLVVSDDIGGGWSKEPDPSIMAYCREIGVGFRDDSIFCFPPPGTDKYCPFAYWAHDGWARKFAPKYPVVVEAGHATVLQDTPRWDDEAHVRCVEAYQASYFSIHDFPDVHLKKSRAAIDRINRILGYRFELRKVEYPSVAKRDAPLDIASTWVNVGVAPRTRETALAWSLLNPDGSVAWCVTDDAFDFRSLEPKLKGVEKPRTVTTPCRFGFEKRVIEVDPCVAWARKAGRTVSVAIRSLKPGDYTLAVSVGRFDGTPEIALPLEGEIGKTRRYAVGAVRITD